MGILEDSFGSGGQEVVQLENLVDVGGEKIAAPQSAIRNRAATTAMLSTDPAKAVDNYQLMMRESQDGSDQTLKSLQEQTVKMQEPQDMEGLMHVLADPKISVEQKRNAMGAIQKSQFLKEPSNTLFTNVLQKGSKGESIDNEDARLSTADALREMYDARKEMQAIVNARAAKLDSSTGRALGEMSSLMVVPLANNIMKGRVVNQAAENAGMNLSAWDKVMNFITPGSATMNVRKHLESLPPKQKVEFTKHLVDAIGSSSGLMFQDDNHFAQYDALQTMIEEGGYANWQAWIDDVSGVLDVVGLGQVLRGAAKGAKASGKAAANAAARATYDAAAEKAVNDYGKARRPGSAAPGVSDAENVVHKADWELVPDPKAPPSRQLPEWSKKLPYNKEDAIKRIELNSVKATENPIAPAKIVQQANPEQARNLHKAIVEAADETVAEAMYGTSRMDAIVGDIYPQIGTNSGAVASKVPNIDSTVHVDDFVKAEIHNDGATYFTEAEKAAGAANIAHRVNNFAEAGGMSINDAMTSFRIDGGRTIVSGVYGTPQGSFSNAREAFEQAKAAFRSEGILDSEIKILEKRGLDHVPVSLDEVADRPGNYLVQVDYTSAIRPMDIGGLEVFDVKRNALDRMGMLVSEDRGSASRWVFDAASMLHEHITGPAVVVSDRTSRFEKMMLGMASEFSDRFMKLDSHQKWKLNDYIRDANVNGVPFDAAAMRAGGHSDEAIEAAQKWRKYWDTHYYLENYDLVKTLDNNGFHLIDTQQGDRLIAKPISKDSTIGNVYDPATGTIRVLDKAEYDQLYNTNGTAARLRRPITVGNKTSEYMIARNTPTEYFRKLRENDKVLNYREGYYQVQYKAPKYIDEHVVDANGKSYTKAIAVAGDTAEAERFKVRMERNNPGTKYTIRGDDRAVRKDLDAQWDIDAARGRIAQRVRGTLLEDAQGMNHLGNEHHYVLNPVDSAVRAARSISGRTVSRPMIDALKARYVESYGHLSPHPVTKENAYPKSVAAISEKGNPEAGLVADARTTYEYIRYLENGYINRLDNFIKSGFRVISQMAGEKGLTKLERAAMKGSEVSVTGKLKGGVFMSYIGAHPLRQLIVQPQQAIRMIGYNPVGWANFGVPRLMVGYTNEILGIASTAESKAFRRFVDETGMLDAVDKENLIRGTLMDAADTHNKYLRAAKAPLVVARKVGFDIGEMTNLLIHMAAVYEKYTREGIDLANKANRDIAHSKVRALSGDMNFAGDMPNNQTTPAAVLQFLQVPQKAMLQSTNRRLTRMERARLAIFDTIAWGPPVKLIAGITGLALIPKEEGPLKEYLEWGTYSMILNTMLSKITGEKQDIDFSSLGPGGLNGWMQINQDMMTGGPFKVLANSPSGKLFLKDGGRVPEAIRMFGRYFGAFEDFGDDRPTAMMVAKEIAKITSGYSAYDRFQIMNDFRRALDKKGNVTDQEITQLEAWFALASFSPKGIANNYEAANIANDMVKADREKVMRDYNSVKQYYYSMLGGEGIDSADPEFMTKVTGFLLERHGKNPEAMKIIEGQLKIDLEGKDSALLKLLTKAAGIPDAKRLQDAISISSIPEEDKKQLRDYIDSLDELRNEPN